MTIGKKAVVLFSGGLDSTTVLTIAISEGYDVYALSFDYGQTHKSELEAATRIAMRLGVGRHVILKIDLRAFGGSALTDDIEIPKNRSIESMGEGIPATYVPARNTVFLSLGLAWAEAIDAGHIFIGVNALDYSGYPDCRPEFIEAFQRLANLATKAGTESGVKFEVHTPLIAMTKKEIIQAGLALGVDYSITSTCYDPSPAGEACGQCDACLLRLKGFAEAGLADPASYVEGKTL
ncbi:7-cyano-7-deazaguanine synthase QueC [Tunturiibacter lichenicola]|uniref:7-cyano-7-deazaguanine synthase QueC n=1 Tax=Tunturiibacter lichenicola TaxID=2051959 RepID=UPI003D9AC7A3